MYFAANLPTAGHIGEISTRGTLMLPALVGRAGFGEFRTVSGRQARTWTATPSATLDRYTTREPG